MKYAPIALSVYTRINHIKRTVEALEKNTLASESELYVFSDAAKPGDEERVQLVRNYVNSITGFRRVGVIERSENGRVKNNRGGIEQLLNAHGRVIFMEEDIQTAPGFLRFINDALSTYENEPSILSVSGHSPNLKHFSSKTQDMFLTRRFHGWGVGFWEDKYYSIKKLPDWKEIRSNKKTISELKKMGSDMVSMVKRESKGETNALDIRACYLCAKQNLWNVIPTITLVKNTGLDNTGVHCDNPDQYATHKLNMKTSFVLPSELQIDDEALLEYRLFYSRIRHIPARVKARLWKLGVNG